MSDESKTTTMEGIAILIVLAGLVAMGYAIGWGETVDIFAAGFLLVLGVGAGLYRR